MRRCLIFAAALLCLPAADAATCDFSAVDARVQQLLDAAAFTDAGIALGTPRGILYKRYFGTYGDASVVPIASASKLLSAVRVMQLVDRGAIDLDTPVSTYLPAFTGDKGAMTVRRMFSHTAGYGNDEDALVLAAQNLTLEQSVNYVACCMAMPYGPPGSAFAYGGISMQVAGYVAQVRGGEDWEQGWKNHVGAPLGVTTIDWQGLGATANYRISGSARASLADYARVVAMLSNDGVGNGRRILSTTAIATLNRDQTGGAPLAYAPPAANGSTAYGIGNWIEPFSISADAPTISSTGAFGFTPWVDFGARYWGVLMVQQPSGGSPTIGQRSHEAVADISAIVRPLLAQGCDLAETFDAIFRDGAEVP